MCLINKNQTDRTSQRNQNTSQNSQSNWYARMHELPEDTDRLTGKQRLNLSIFFRIWFMVALIVIIAGFVVFEQLFEHVEPTAKQVIEDTLVDTGKLLAMTFAKPLETGQLYQADYQAKLDRVFATKTESPLSTNHARFLSEADLNILSTWFDKKTHSNFRVYVTDITGTVIYDSLPTSTSADSNKTSSQSQSQSNLDSLQQGENAEGKDYSQWNDVYLTLQGKYGARSTRSDKEDSTTSIMYVAQPIINAQGTRIGVVSVGKPVATILPYLNVARQRMLTTSLIIMLISVMLAGIIAWWLQQSIALVTRYTQSLALTTNKPSFYLGRELNELVDTIEDMKHRLENRAYVTDYVHTLTHELKSPLTAIRASGELLADINLDEEDRQTLSHTIDEQSQKLQALIDRLLLLAKVEQPSFQLNRQPINLLSLLQHLINNHQASIQKRGIEVLYQQAPTTDSIEQIKVDKFWLSQALDNLLTNAIHFADKQIQLTIKVQALSEHLEHLDKPQDKALDKPYLMLQLFNDGEHIPEYAMNKIFDRYFSLAHQAKQTKNHAQPLSTTADNQDEKQYQKSNQSGSKGTGLGLTLAKQVIEHHQGIIRINNIKEVDKQGVCVTVYLPFKI